MAAEYTGSGTWLRNTLAQEHGCGIHWLRNMAAEYTGSGTPELQHKELLMDVTVSLDVSLDVILRQSTVSVEQKSDEICLVLASC